MESHQCQLFSKWNAIIMALHKIILFELLLWIQNWNQREFCIPFGSRISNIYSWILFYMQHTNDVQLLRSLHEKKSSIERKAVHFKFSLGCAHVHVHLHDCLSSSSIFFLSKSSDTTISITICTFEMV